MDLFKLKRISDKVYNFLLSPTVNGHVSIQIKNNVVIIIGMESILDSIFQSNIFTEEEKELIEFVVIQKIMPAEPA